MSHPAATSTAPTGLARLAAFTTADEGRPALLGFLGAALIALGGLGAGSTRLHDPLLESMHLSWLRFGHGLVVSSVLLWAGVALMLLAWLWLGRRVVNRRAGAQRPGEEMRRGETSEYTLVFPKDADIESGRISVMSPIGTAILGYSVGDAIEWTVPAGTRRIRIEAVPYQPEAAGDYHL